VGHGRAKRVLSAVERDQVIMLYQKGQSMERLAKHFNAGYYQIRQIVLAAGIKPHSAGGNSVQLSYEITQAASKLYKAGQSVRGVANQLGLTFSHVTRALEHTGTAVRTRSEACKAGVAAGRYLRCGGRKTDRHGYVMRYIGNGKYRPEHCLIWEQHSGSLPKGWHVHHINGVKDDNRIENLQAMPSKKHAHVIELMQGHIQHLEREVAELKTDVEALRRQRSRTT